MNVLVAAASKHGATWEIACTIADTLKLYGVHADVAHIEDVDDITKYDAFVLGSAVYMDHWMDDATAFVRKHAAGLNTRPVWLFSSGPLGSPPHPHEGKSVDMRQITELIRVKEHRIFAGRLKKQRLHLPEKLIATMVHAPQGDFRNWSEIRAWAAGIVQLLQKDGRQKDTSRAMPLQGDPW